MSRRGRVIRTRLFGIGRFSAPKAWKTGTSETVFHGGNIPLKPGTNHADVVGAHHCGAKVIYADLISCVRCGHTWEYSPGSGIRRGMTKYGPVCGRPWCEELGNSHWEAMLENIEAGRWIGHGKVSVSVTAAPPKGGIVLGRG